MLGMAGHGFKLVRLVHSKAFRGSMRRAGSEAASSVVSVVELGR